MFLTFIPHRFLSCATKKKSTPDPIHHFRHFTSVTARDNKMAGDRRGASRDPGSVNLARTEFGIRVRGALHTRASISPSSPLQIYVGVGHGGSGLLSAAAAFLRVLPAPRAGSPVSSLFLSILSASLFSLLLRCSGRRAYLIFLSLLKTEREIRHSDGLPGGSRFLLFLLLRRSRARRMRMARLDVNGVYFMGRFARIYSRGYASAGGRPGEWRSDAFFFVLIYWSYAECGIYLDFRCLHSEVIGNAVSKCDCLT